MSEQEPVVRAVLGQVDWWWSALFWPRVRGLTDDEYLWSPVERCWTIHPDPNGRSDVDYHWPPPNPTPFTTIAWRLAHIGLMLAQRTALYFPEHAPEPWDLPPHTHTSTPFPPTADDAIAFVERWWHGWRAGVEAGGADRLWAAQGDAEGSFPEMQLASDDPFLHMVLHCHRELIHHGAEIAVLRDLYLARHARDPYVDAILDADETTLAELEQDDPTIVDRYRSSRPDLPMRAAETGTTMPLRLLAARAFDVNALVDGHTPLHHLVAHGNLDLFRDALALGADPTVRDARWNLDATGWASYFNREDIAEHLAQAGGPS